MRPIRSILAAILLLLSLASTGCVFLAVAGITAGATYAYVDGWLERDYNLPLNPSFDASIEGLKSLNIVVTATDKNLSSGDIEGDDAGNPVWVKLKARSSSVTTISVRVGYLGDQTASQRIHDAIFKHMRQP